MISYKVRRFKEIAFSIILICLVSCNQKSKITFYPKPDSRNEQYIIILAGQSNMKGLGELNALEKQKFENISYFNFDKITSVNHKNTFGPEIGLSQVLAEKFPTKNFILIKYAIGGSSLYDWSPDYSVEKAIITKHPENGNLYDSLMKHIAYSTNNLKPKYVALVWMQGERDSKVVEAGLHYQENLTSFIHSIRKDLNQPDLPIIIGEVSAPKFRHPAVHVVGEAQININSEIQNTFLIRTKDLEKFDDSLHYSTKGQLTFGYRIGKKLTEILQK